MSIEVWEEKPSERRFVVTHNGVVIDWVKKFTEAELRELVEKGARALGYEASLEGGLAQVASNAYLARENTRLRAWLQAITEQYRLPVTVNPYEMARKALAGEEAPKP